ncbi:DUF4160 domain-containing protein [Methylorubrum salsuginis]|uniref:DUF4160 domain-containing protein n=1 Tax=Methylorubrum salsuginis TaxID=414703 RepID=UPI001FCE26CD|nr:DUF4160 domain-containing protein [Methylorubrum salsuginis]
MGARLQRGGAEGASIPPATARHHQKHSPKVEWYLSSLSDFWTILIPSPGALTGRLHQFGKVVITVYGNDHLPPHFHVLSPDAEALVEIATLAVLAGSLPSRIAREALAWAAANIDRIRAEWNRINPRFPIA